MSAILPSTPPSRPPLPAAPPVAVPPPQGSRKPYVYGVLAVLVVGAGLAYWALRSPQATPGGKGAPTGPRLLTIQTGALSRVVRLSGTTSATRFANVMAPELRGPDAGRALVLVEIAKPGSIVQQGALLARIDGQSLSDHIDDVQSTVEQAMTDVRKRLAEQSIEMENLMQTLRVAKAEADKAALDAQAAEVKTDVERELLKLAAEEAKARYEQLQKDAASRKAAHAAEKRILEITTRRHEMHRDRHKNDLVKFTVYAPMTGLVVMQQIWRSGQFAQVRQGDILRPQQPFMKVVDTNSMQVESLVNQVEGSQIRVNQKATIGLDAFPDLRFEGEVYSMGALATMGWRENFYIRTIPVKIRIKGSDPRLIPDLSAWAEIHLGRKENVTLLPLEALHSKNGKDFVYLKKGDKFTAQEVRLGERNYTHAEVVAGLKAGDVVAVEKPEEPRKATTEKRAQS